MNNNPIDNKKVDINSFLTLSVIGKGSYAKVILVKKKESGELFAMKVIKKSSIQRKRQADHIYIEKNVLTSLQHPFLIKFYYSFQTENKLFFVLEYCPAGELFNLLQKRKRFSEEQARFYSAQMVLAIEHMHTKDIIYRDLKPENVLLDKSGYIRLTDFGLSRMNAGPNEDVKSICGTPEYMAPEILMKLGYGKAIDWWTLGCIIYEMTVGLPPFYCNDRNELFERIKYSNPKYPSSISPQLRSLLEGLFKKDSAKRLGSNGVEEIKKHPWFDIINWDYMLEKKYEAPFVPKMKNETDLVHFDPEFLEIPINSMSINEKNAMGHLTNFEGFSYDNRANLDEAVLNKNEDNEFEMKIE